MFCRRYRRKLMPYIEGTLPRHEHEQVEMHLSRCAKCAAELKTLQSVALALEGAKLPPVEPAPDMRARVLAQIAEPAPRQVRRLVWGTVPAAASALFVITAAVLLKAPTPVPKDTWEAPKETTQQVEQAPVNKSTEANKPAEKSAPVNMTVRNTEVNAEASAKSKPGSSSIALKPEGTRRADTARIINPQAASHRKANPERLLTYTDNTTPAVSAPPPAQIETDTFVATKSTGMDITWSHRTDKPVYDGDRLANLERPTTPTPDSLKSITGFELKGNSYTVRAKDSVAATCALPGENSASMANETAVDVLNRTSLERVQVVFSY